MLIKIETDNYFISQRIKEIDINYFLMFNTKTKKFEVHNKRQAGNTFCVGLPFITLDERSLDYIQKTRIENIDNLIKEMDKENEKIENNQNKKIKEKIKEVLYDS